MSELRWTLLILGVVFIAALSWWERRRPRQAFAPRLREASLPHGEFPHGDFPHGELPHASAQRTAGTDPAAVGEPWIGEAGLSEVVSSDVALSHADDGHEPAGDEAVMHAHAGGGPRPLGELPTLVIPDEDERLELRAAWDAHPPEPKLIDPEAAAIPGVPASAAAPASADASVSADAAVSVAAPEPSQSPVRSPGDTPAALEIPGAEGVGAVRIVEPAPIALAAPPPEPLVDWPPEESRRILSLRLVAPPPERFPGRNLRLALAAEGFLLGKFAIFHKPDESNRAVLSAASLTRPGAFDITTMDSQRYAGLSLFAVLPGAKTPQQAFDELLATARNLNERLQGALQDERGGPLTPLRVASIRETLRAEGNPPAAATQ